ncbi:hypothetical protein [Rhizobium sp. Leaf341]|uniref:hypothetical protein n=1 Tax=Rhizobium sp. Leaf341 TaxID=1736344 RepID=UPI000713BBD0|nr:hypothetical protein [Rhizobium sp. Leaf341]KQR75919.1 hypothetical protein ASG03_19935 [Rhizobium sp. Leaf341]
MPNRDPLPTPETDTPRGPISTPGIPDRGQDSSPVPPVITPGDTKNPNDPALLPIGDPAGIA